MNGTDDKRQQTMLEQILRNLHEIKYQNESTSISPLKMAGAHQQYMNHFSDTQSMNNSHYNTHRRGGQDLNNISTNGTANGIQASMYGRGPGNDTTINEEQYYNNDNENVQQYSNQAQAAHPQLMRI